MMTPEQQVEFDRLNAEASGQQMTPAQRAEFDRLNAPLTKTRWGGGRQRTSKPTPGPQGPSIGEQGADLLRSAGGDVSDASKFLMDTSQMLNVTDWGDRHEAGMAGTANTGEGGERTIMDRVTAFPRYLHGFATHESAQDKYNKELLETDVYDEQIPKGVSPILDTAKNATKLAVDLGMTAFAGGAARVPAKEVVKTGAAMVGAGTAGQELAGTPGELTGVIMGALSRDPKSLASLGGMLTSIIQGTKNKGRVLKRAVRSGDTLATASDSEIRAGMRELLKNATMPDGSPMTAEQFDMIYPRIKAALADGQKGTVGQLVDDLGVRQMEKDVAASGTREQAAALRQIDADIEASALQSVKEIAPQGVTERAPALPRAITEATRREIDDIPAAARVKRLEAEQADEAAGEVFKQAGDRPETSTALTGAIQKKADKSYAAVKKKWAEVSGGKPITKQRVEDEFAEFYGVAGLNETKQKRLRKSFPATFEAIADLGDEVDLDDVSDIISIMSSESRQIKAGSKTGSGLQHVEGMKEALYAALDTSKKGAATARSKAAQAYKQHMETFGDRSAVGKAMKSEEDIVAEKLIKPNPAGASVLKKTLESTGANAEAANVLRSRFREEVLDGNVTPAAFEKKYREHLKIKGMEDLKTQVDESVSTADALRRSTQDLSAAETQAAKDITTLEKSDIGILGATGTSKREVVAAAKRAMAPAKGKDVAGELRKMLKGVGDNPQARDDIRRAFAEEFSNTITKDGRLSKSGYDTFKQKRSAYEDSGLFTTKELDNIEKSLVEGQKLFMGDDVIRLKALPPEKRRVSEAVAAIAGAKVGAYTFGSPLIGAAMGRKFAVEQLNKMSSEKARKLAFELSTNPDKYVKWIDKLTNVNASPKEIDSALVEMFDAALAGARSQAVGDE